MIEKNLKMIIIIIMRCIIFTGIVQDLGSVKLIKGGLYKVNTNLDLSECKEGSSISYDVLTAKNIKTIKIKTQHLKLILEKKL